MSDHTQIYINGQWVAPSSTDTIEVFNSTTEAVMGTIPSATAQDATKACAAARAAFEGLGRDVERGAHRAARQGPSGPGRPGR